MRLPEKLAKVTTFLSQVTWEVDETLKGHFRRDGDGDGGVCWERGPEEGVAATL